MITWLPTQTITLSSPETNKAEEFAKEVDALKKPDEWAVGLTEVPPLCVANMLHCTLTIYLSMPQVLITTISPSIGRVE